MANISILWRKPTDAGAYSGGSWVGGLPLANLVDQDVKKVARTTDATIASTQFRVDCGTAPEFSSSEFVMLGHNGSTLAKWRVLLSDNADASAPVYDSGLVDMWVPTVVWGSLPWGSFPWDGVDSTAYPGGTVAFIKAPQSYFARYRFIYVQDTSNASGYFQAGRYFDGEAWSPERNFQIGATIEPHDPSPSQRTRGGRKLTRTLPQYRIFKFNLAFLTEAEAMGIAFELMHELGVGGDFFIVWNSDDDPSVLFRRAIYCSLQQTSEIVLARPRGSALATVPGAGPYPYSWSFVAEELV